MQLALAAEGEERERLFKKADNEAKLAITLSGHHPLKLMHRAHLNLLRGRNERALRLLREMRRRRWVGSKQSCLSRFHMAMVHASVGKTDRALKSLDTACRARDQYLFLMKVEPRLDGLRDDPRFRDFLNRLGLS